MSSELAAKVLEGQTRAIARAITLVENADSSAGEVMKEVFPKKQSLYHVRINNLRLPHHPSFFEQVHKHRLFEILDRDICKDC